MKNKKLNSLEAATNALAVATVESSDYIQQFTKQISKTPTLDLIRLQLASQNQEDFLKPLFEYIIEVGSNYCVLEIPRGAISYDPKRILDHFADAELDTIRGSKYQKLTLYFKRK